MANANWLSLQQARQQLFSLGQTPHSSLYIPIANALGRVTALAITAPIKVPQHANSAMDGYAVRSHECRVGTKLQVTATVLAGDSQLPKILPGECARITTGAMIPPACDAVIMQENVQRDANIITLTTAVHPNENIRAAGSDITTGDCIIERGHRLTAADLTLVSSLGLAEVCVTPTLKVGILATGDELVEPGQALSPGKIYESNCLGVQGLLSPLNVDIVQYGIITDSPTAIETVLQQANSECDLVISSGGVSVGDADYVKQVLVSIGHIEFWNIAIKPGKPFAFGKLSHALFCGLPGNPVSAYVTTEQLVVPLIRHLQGEQLSDNSHRLTLRAKITHAVSRRAGRLDFQRAQFTQRENGDLVVTALSRQSSGVMTSFSKANCYLLIPAQTAQLQPGDWVEIQPFSIPQ